MRLLYSTVVQGNKVGQLVDHAFKIIVNVNVQKVIKVPRSRIKSLDNVSLIVKDLPNVGHSATCISTANKINASSIY